ncbi:DUF1351 domain-containing protein [Macrococcus armenti]|uniref:DUF1351 domain-containing protein n=1 Tax=Macrococcus armenti TaxID=2875764 RepID=UPI001CD1B423|nr:DUF1351 domain-containing protein [Macrococcus armenti]UBH10111.1 DUF1351 domain-containing protein [Macrococcus armenti]
MENGLMNTSNCQIILRKPSEVEFVGYEQLKASAIKLAERVAEVQVTTENVKQSKKLIAEINKESKAINDARIKLKKDLLKPYEDIELKVKEIDVIIKQANDNVKSQISELDQLERQEKKVQIEEIFNKRIKNYKFKDLFTFDDFIEPTHLNKSVSINKVEDEIVTWLERIRNDFEVIKTLEHSDEVLTEYQEIKDLALSIQSVTNRHQRLADNRKAIENAKSKKELRNEIKYVTFAIREENSKFVELLLKENNIEFKTNI